MLGREDELRITLQHPHHVVHVAAHLLERALFAHGAAIGQQLDLGFRGGQDVVEPPVLDLQDEQTVVRMNDHEVRMPSARPDRQVVPDDGVVLEEVLQALGQAQLAAGVEAGGAE